MDPAVALRMCDDILDFCEGWQPRPEANAMPHIQGVPGDGQDYIHSIREWILYNNCVTDRQAEVLAAWQTWVERCRAHSEAAMAPEEPLGT